MRSYEDVLSQWEVEIPAHLIADAEVPVLAGVQRQGDIIVIPVTAAKVIGVFGATATVPPEGVAVVRGEATGNTHLLVADGDVTWAPLAESGLTLGVVTVAEGATAFLLHQEHGAQGFAPGCYRISRQREQADVIRVVAD